MADVRITALTADANPTVDDLIVTVNDPGGTPGNRRVTLDNLDILLAATARALTNKDISSGTNTYRAASTTVVGAAEIATAAETTTGTDATRTVSPDGLAHSQYGSKLIQVIAIDALTAVTTGDGKVYFNIPPELNGFDLIDADACITTTSSSGLPTIQIANVTQAADMLTTRITIDTSELTSYTAATPPVIDTANDDVATGDQLRIDVDVAGTGTTGLRVLLTFRLP